MGYNAVEVISHKKCHDISFSGSLNKSEISTAPYVHSIHTDLASKVLPKKDAKESFLQYRYLVVLMEFLIFCEINCFRQNTSVSIVAMVNNSAIHLEGYSNSSILSCPLDAEENEVDQTSEIEGEFDWSPEIQGYILGAGFLGYVITQMPGGLLAEAFGGKIVIVSGIYFSSMCHLITPFISRTDRYLLIFTQLLRGMGQGLLPAAHCVLAANWFPRNERGLLNTIVMSGYAVGALVGGLASGVICSSELVGGWSFGFYMFGGLGILLGLSLHFFLFEAPTDHPRITDKELEYIRQNQEMDMSQKRSQTPWRHIFRSVPVYALILTLFGQFWVGTHFTAVHPTFLSTILHFPIQENGIFSSVPFLLQALFTLITSWVSNWLNTNRYVGVDKLRKGFNFLCCLSYSSCLVGIYFAGCDKWINIVFAFWALAATGFAYGGSMIAAVDMSPTFAGSLMGMASTIASTAGFVLPVVVGFLTNDEQTLEQWNKLFFISIALVMTSGIIFCVFGSAEVQPWNFPTTEDVSLCAASNKCQKTEVLKEQAGNAADAVIHL